MFHAWDLNTIYCGDLLVGVSIVIAECGYTQPGLDVCAGKILVFHLRRAAHTSASMPTRTHLNIPAVIITTGKVQVHKSFARRKTNIYMTLSKRLGATILIVSFAVQQREVAARLRAAEDDHFRESPCPYPWK